MPATSRPISYFESILRNAGHGKQDAKRLAPGAKAKDDYYAELVDRSEALRREQWEREHVGYLYCLRSARAWKIGFSKNPMKRGCDLQTGLAERPDIFLVVRGPASDERRVHEALAKFRECGEWFADCASVQNFLFQFVHTQMQRTK